MRRDGDVGMKTLEENVPPDHRPDQAQSAQHLFPHRPASARARFPQYPCLENQQLSRFLEGLDMSRGNILRYVPFIMSGHLIFNFFQTLITLLFNKNPNHGCPKRIYQHSGQAHKHFSHRFHGVSFLGDVQT